MIISNVISIGNVGFIYDKLGSGFLWKVDLTYIPRLRPNLNFCLAGREQQSQWE